MIKIDSEAYYKVEDLKGKLASAKVIRDWLRAGKLNGKKVGKDWMIKGGSIIELLEKKEKK